MGKRDKMTQTAGHVDEGITRKFTFNAKEGIDNPAMVITDEADSETTARPRLCVLKREEEGESLGFHLSFEGQGHIIRNLTPGGIAERGGVQDGDRVLEVNCCFVDDFSHDQATMKIKQSGNQISLLVLSDEEYERCRYKGHDLRNMSRVYKDKCCKPPRLCHITKDPVSGLGLALSAVEGQKGHFSVNAIAGGAAEKAGVVKGDRLVWMGGATVEELTYSALTRMLKKCGNQITIMVVDAESEKYYNYQGIPILPAMATTHNLPDTARKLHLVRGKEGYGFSLRLEMSLLGYTSHVLREIDVGGPAEKAGMRDGDLLMEVNGEAVESLEHDKIVDRIKQSGQKVTLTTISSKGRDFFTKLGLSPLLFCEEVMAKEKNISAQASLMKEDAETSGKSRLCSVQKGPLGFGFSLNSVAQKSGIYTCISQVVDGGPGQKAGLLKGDIVLEVNGHRIEEKTLEDVILLMKEGRSSVSLRVIDPETCSKEEEEETPEVSFL